MLESHGADEVDDCRLRGVVVGVERVTFHAVRRSGAEDDAGIFLALVLLHALEGLHDAKAHTVKVDAHHALPLGKVGLDELLADRNARVGDQDVDAAEDLVHLSERALTLSSLLTSTLTAPARPGSPA